MKIIISKDFESLSLKATIALIEIMSPQTNPLICVASGDSPSGIYKNFVELVKKNELTTDHWRFLGLDEWVGLNGTDEGSCRWHLNKELFSPLDIKEDSICFFDGASKDLDQECAYTESYIQKQSGIEIAILGLGMNGHIGMNEPNTLISSRSHIVELDPITISVGQKYFNKPQPLTKGITLGIATLLEAKHILLVVSGAKKADIVKQVIEGPISAAIPASLLKNHPHCSIYLDEAAASKLSS